MATHSSWEILWSEEPGRLKSVHGVVKKARYDLKTKQQKYLHS